MRAKSFQCDHAGCHKSFTRAEHLQRHALNHVPGGWACPVCSANFKRPDLLERHMERHRQKDTEAGGPGCGRLDTRKRAWRAADGSVVPERPQGRGQAPRASHARRRRVRVHQEPSPAEAEAETNALIQTDPSLDLSLLGPISEQFAIPSKPSSHHVEANDRSCNNPRSSFSSSADTLSDFLNQGVQSRLSEVHEGLSADVREPIALDPELFNDQLEYDQAFPPDTASSFNMPFTTAIDYNWLLQMDRGTVEATSSAGSAFRRSKSRRPPACPQVVLLPESPSSLAETPDHEREGISGDGIQPLMQSSPPEAQARAIEPDAGSQEWHSNHGQSAHQTGRATQGPRVEYESPLAMSNDDSQLPRMTEGAREGLLAVVESAHPSLPSGTVSIRNEPLFSLASLQSFLILYLTKFNTAYPLIHVPTFRPDNAEPLLLLSLVLLGATSSTKEAHHLAVCIHDVIRPSIFAHAGFSARPHLWTLQTILLVECFGKSRAGQKQHDMSHLFHGLLINLIRRSDCQSVKPSGPPNDPSNCTAEELDSAWRKWAIAEQKKRLAIICFIWDTQHAVLFCQSLCMSAFELRLDMPCSQKSWEAGTAASWASAWSSSHNVPFLAALKSYLSAPTPPLIMPRPQRLGALARVLVLHGIMATYWDMQRREQTSLGVIQGEGGRNCWRQLIGRAYDAWKVDFDAYCARLTDMVPPQDRDSLGGEEVALFTAAYRTLYHTLHLILHADILDVQIYAGAKNILGRPVQQRDYLRSARVVKKWASAATDDDDEDMRASPHKSVARLAAWHAARVLRDGSNLLLHSAASGLVHVPWCLYLGTLTCWAHHHARPWRPGLDETVDEMVWDPEGDMLALVTDMTKRSDGCASSRERQINGLVWTMAEGLSKVRWGIVHAGVLVLKGLVPQRLINQYEDYEE